MEIRSESLGSWYIEGVESREDTRIPGRVGKYGIPGIVGEEIESREDPGILGRVGKYAGVVCTIFYMHTQIPTHTLKVGVGI